jgi:para-nitrobenzyl esterase
VPVIISWTLEDAALGMTNFNVDEAGLKASLTNQFGAKADEVYALYRKHAPQKSPYLILAQVATDARFRRSAVTQAERKVALGKAPAYVYQWNWESPGYGGKFGAVHGVDVAASFHHVRSTIMGVGDPVGKVMCDRLASVWVAFAKTGDPNNPRIPNWPAYNTTTRPTMIFDTDTRIENDPRGEIRKYWEQTPPARGVTG